MEKERNKIIERKSYWNGYILKLKNIRKKKQKYEIKKLLEIKSKIRENIKREKHWKHFIKILKKRYIKNDRY